MVNDHARGKEGDVEDEHKQHSKRSVQTVGLQRGQQRGRTDTERHEVRKRGDQNGNAFAFKIVSKQNMVRELNQFAICKITIKYRSKCIQKHGQKMTRLCYTEDAHNRMLTTKI